MNSSYSNNPVEYKSPNMKFESPKVCWAYYGTHPDVDPWPLIIIKTLHEKVSQGFLTGQLCDEILQKVILHDSGQLLDSYQLR